MTVGVTGTRGIPAIPGGVETHCQQLYPRLASKCCRVTVFRRSCYVTNDNRRPDFEGVSLVDIYAPRRKSIEAITHTTLATLKAWRMGVDILHIHTVGPSLLAPLARLLGLKVVCTNHGPDYQRAKWGWAARQCIHLGEWCQVKCAHHIIAISQNIAEDLRRNYGRTHGVTVIPNGVERMAVPQRMDFLSSLNLTPGGYVLAMARFVPEKRIHLLIEAFSRLGDTGVKLAIAGDADHDDDYSRSLKQQARLAGVTLTGYVQGNPLNQLLHGARLFVLPSSHEGLPIALLEAMSCQVDVLVSDIPANRLPQLDTTDFFVTDSIDDLTEALRRKLSAPAAERVYDLSPYNWDTIAQRTLEVYRQTLES
ncbi:MAG: glycosyltransferase family 4 protein [Muribaculaceae bacterium]|nr:glycosyltransferase family 4 protein [Muribaculaceae bacterium]